MRLTVSLVLLTVCLLPLLPMLLGACVTRTEPAPRNAVLPTPTRAELKVMSFNIRYGTALDGDNHWSRRRDGLLEVLAHESPELLGLQESLKFQVDEILSAMPRYAAVFAGRDDGDTRGEACAILYDQRRFDLVDSGTFWLSDTPDVPSNSWKAACLRICTWARLRDRVSGRSLYHYNTHLDHMSEPAREKGMRLVLDRIKARPHSADPVVLTGDFNDGERSTTARLAASEMLDTFRAAHPDLAHHGVGTFNGFKNKTDGEKIDYLLVTPGLEVLKSEIVRTTIHGHNVSDHFPITTTLRL